MARFLAGLAFAAAVLEAVYLAFGATSTSVRCDSTGCVTSHSTLIEDNGVGVIALLVIPIIATSAAFTLMVRHGSRIAEWALALLLFAACVVSIFSVGFFFLPAAFLLIIAAASDRRDSQPA